MKDRHSPGVTHQLAKIPRAPKAQGVKEGIGVGSFALRSKAVGETEESQTRE